MSLRNLPLIKEDAFHRYAERMSNPDELLRLLDRGARYCFNENHVLHAIIEPLAASCDSSDVVRARFYAVLELLGEAYASNVYKSEIKIEQSVEH